LLKKNTTKYSYKLETHLVTGISFSTKICVTYTRMYTHYFEYKIIQYFFSSFFKTSTQYDLYFWKLAGCFRMWHKQYKWNSRTYIFNSNINGWACL